MSKPQPPAARAMGVNPCGKGWIGITNDEQAYYSLTIDALIAAADSDRELAVIAVNTPIGLPDNGPRQADLDARALLGRRAGAAPMTPLRSALEAATYKDAAALQKKATGKGLTVQAFAQRTRLLELDAWRRATDRIVMESNAELSFRYMAGRPPKFAKATWAGMDERSGLLYDNLIHLPGDLGKAGEVAAPDNVLDAAAALWTAIRFATRTATSHPGKPEIFSDGLPAAIWA